MKKSVAVFIGMSVSLAVVAACPSGSAFAADVATNSSYSYLPATNRASLKKSRKSHLKRLAAVAKKKTQEIGSDDPADAKDSIETSAAAPNGPGAGEVSTTVEKSFYDRLSDKFALTYFGIYRGGPLNSLGNNLQPTTSGSLDPTSPQQLESYVTTGYKLDPNTVVGVVTHFYYFPTMSPTSESQPGQAGMDVQMLDPEFLISRANWIDSNGFKLKGMLYVTPPVTMNDYLRKHDESLIIAPTISATWDIPRTRWTLGLYGYVADYLPSSATPDSARSYKIYAAPNANYQFAKTVSATMWVDLVQATRAFNTPIISGMNNPTMDIEPGINWDISSHFSVNPVLNIYPSTPTIAATSLQAIIIGRL